ncbi:DoxX family protein [Hydrogenophaga sp. XSHU_21]
MNALQTPFSLLARLLMAALFLPAGISKIGGFAGTAGYIGSVGLPLPEVGAALAIAIEVIAPILLIIGLYTRQAALVLAVFTLAATVLFHNYWAMPAEQQFMQSLMFFKNVGVVGGLLAIAAFGAGKLSLDARRAA